MRVTAPRCHIRPMEPGDIPQVLDIERASFPTMWPQTVYQRELKNHTARYLAACETPDAAPPSPPSAEDAAPRGLGGIVRRFLGGLAEAPTRERVLGMVGLWLLVDEAHIVTIAVRPDQRRQGIGELLLVAALEAARDAGMDTVTLEYRVSNTAAQRLYEKYGFAKVGVRARYYSDNNEDAVLMTTPSLSSPEYQALLARRVGELRARWGDAFPLGEGALRSDAAGAG